MSRIKVFGFAAAIILSVGGFFVYQRFYKSRPIKNPSALSVNSFFGEADVFLNDEQMGSTPLYKEGLESGQISLTLRGDSNIFESKVTLTSDTLTVVNRDLGVPGGFSAGEIIWLEKSNFSASLSVISDPSSATVSIDGIEVGETPFSTTSISSGDHELTIGKEGFESRSIKVRVQDGYKLNVSSALFPRPIPLEIKTMESTHENLTVYNLSLNNEIVTVDPRVLAKAIVYWMETRGEESVTFNYFVDREGTIFDSKGAKILPESELPQGSFTVGYLGTSQKDELSEAASTTLASLASGSAVSEEKEETTTTTPTTTVTKVEILPTGTGWLRVRSGPGLGNDEVTKIDVGSKFDLIEEQSGWSKIKLTDGTSGWVSSQYVKKIP